MACPDELTLDLWLADALPHDEAAVVASHVHTCSICVAAEQAAHAFGGELHAALALDAEELAYLSGLKLVSSWRTSTVTAPSWGWIALVAAVAGFAAWWVAAPLFGTALATATQVGLRSVLLNAAFVLVFSLGQALFDLIRSPALGLSQPLLALLALALLVWPRQLIPRHLFPQRRTPA